MSARIISSSEEVKSSPIRWATIQGGVAVQASSSASTAGNGPEDVSTLRARITALEQEAVQRAQQAFHDGEAAGVQKASARFQPAAEKMARMLEELASFKPRLRREAERDLVGLSLAVARRILRRELTVDPEAITGIVKAALDRIDLRELIRIRVHPSDVELLSRWALDARLPQGLEIAGDAALEPGAVVLESARGQFDASVDTQLKEIERGFADMGTSR